MPGELGFYDLRVPEVREAQASLARDHGVEGFCYWHYWFHGKRLLERPFAEVLATGKPNFPFCLAWANESWSRSWLGDDREILVEQRYSHDDDIAHARWLAAAFADSRYIRVHGRPLFLIYRPLNLPDPRKTTETIRHEVTRLGLPEPFLVGINAHSFTTDMRQHGFDLTEHHEPQLGILPGAFDDTPLSRWRRLLGLSHRPKPKIFDFTDACQRMDAIRPTYPHFPAAYVGWDNTPRRGENAIVIHGADAKKFGIRLRTLAQSLATRPWDERIVFINAWNEWAEGMHLEPSLQDGRASLEALRDAIAIL